MFEVVSIISRKPDVLSSVRSVQNDAFDVYRPVRHRTVVKVETECGEVNRRTVVVAPSSFVVKIIPICDTDGRCALLARNSDKSQRSI